MEAMTAIAFGWICVRLAVGGFKFFRLLQMHYEGEPDAAAGALGAVVDLIFDSAICYVLGVVAL